MNVVGFSKSPNFKVDPFYIVPERLFEEKLEKFKMTILFGIKTDGVRKYLEILTMILRCYVFRTIVMFHIALNDLFQIEAKPAKETFPYFGLNCGTNFQKLQNEPLSDPEDLALLFLDKQQKMNDFDLSALLILTERTNHAFPKSLQLMAKEVRKIRNNLAHRFDSDFWTEEKCEKSMEKIGDFSSKVFQQCCKDFSMTYNSLQSDQLDQMKNSVRMARKSRRHKSC